MAGSIAVLPGTPPPLIWVNFPMSRSVGNSFLGNGDAKYGLPITFLNVDGAQTMDFLVPFFFLYKKVVNSLPSGEDVAMSDA